MRVTVLGCSGTFPGPESPCSSYLLEADGFRLLLDVGNGSTGVLQQSIGLLDIDAVLVSHLHGDHYLDLVTYTYARRYHPDGCPGPLPVYGPAGIRDHVVGAFGRPVDELLDAVYDFHEVGGGRLDIGPFSTALTRVNHPIETYAVRAEHDGRSLVYSADTGYCDDLVKAARGADLFLCEASYVDGDENPPDIHLTGREAGEHARRAEVQRLVLTHLVPWGKPDRACEEASAAYAGDVALAETSDSYEV